VICKFPPFSQASKEREYGFMMVHASLFFHNPQRKRIKSGFMHPWCSINPQSKKIFMHCPGEEESELHGSDSEGEGSDASSYPLTTEVACSDVDHED